MPTPIPQSELDALRERLTTIAVTGTNGKTSTTAMVAAIAAAAGQLPVGVTTLGMWVGDAQIAEDGSMESFVRTVSRACASGATTLALEVTSRALAGGFATRWPADVGVFTNITRDHLDRHGTPEAYLAAKAQLFVGARRPRDAVLNAADPAAPLLAEVMAGVPDGGPRCHGFLPAGAAAQPGVDVALAAARVEPLQRGLRVRLLPSPLADALGGSLRLGVCGGFQADNALAAALAAHVAGLPAPAIGEGLARFEGVPGRFEILCDRPLAVVDFAHTPDALDRVLASAGAMARARGGRLGCVFGCGGERDQAKRPAMGALADRHADAVWLTTDNPRSESPRAIADMVRAGAAGAASWHPIPDRREAIAAAAAWARAEDVVVVAGRGHETLQQLAGGPVALSDREVVAACFSARD